MGSRLVAALGRGCGYDWTVKLVAQGCEAGLESA